MVSKVIISEVSWLSTASKIGVLPALSGISIAEWTSTPNSYKIWSTSTCPFSIAWCKTVPPALSYLNADAPLRIKNLTTSLYPPLAAYKRGVQPFGEV